MTQRLRLFSAITFLVFVLTNLYSEKGCVTSRLSEMKEISLLILRQPEKALLKRIGELHLLNFLSSENLSSEARKGSKP